MKVWLPTIRVGTGSDVYVQRLASGLKKRDIQVEITWFDRKYEFCPWLLRFIAPPLNTDIIHANSWNGFAFKRHTIPLVVTEHLCVHDSNYRSYKNWLQHYYHRMVIFPYEQASFRIADRIVAVSQYTAEYTSKVFKCKDVVAIHNWLDDEFFAQAKNSSKTLKNSASDPFQLLFVGNLSKRKGWDLITKIMAKLDHHFHLHCVLGLKNKLPKQVPPHTTIHPVMNSKQLLQMYQGCDALLFPSRVEGFGYVAAEAMVCGKPVIAAQSSSLPEVVVEETGILCSTEDVNAYVTACQYLRNNPDVACAMGQKGRARAVHQFSEAQQIEAYIQLYRELC